MLPKLPPQQCPPDPGVFKGWGSAERMQQIDYRVKMQWDNEASVWIATSQDVPGLVLESETYDVLLEKVRLAIPELIELNGGKPTVFC